MRWRTRALLGLFAAVLTAAAVFFLRAGLEDGDRFASVGGFFVGLLGLFTTSMAARRGSAPGGAQATSPPDAAGRRTTVTIRCGTVISNGDGATTVIRHGDPRRD